MNVRTTKRSELKRLRLLAAAAATLAGPFGAYAATAANIAVTPGVITTYAGTTSNGGGGGFGNGGPATSANLYNPSAVRFDGAGNMYILDAGNMVIRKVIAPGLAGGGTIVAFAGTGIAGNSGDGGQAAGATFSATARGLFVNAAGVIWISDSGNNAIRMIDTTGKITTVAGTNGSAAGYTGDGGPATQATLNNPGGIYVDAAGNLYIADTGNNVIRVVNASGVISTFAGGATGVAPAPSVCTKAGADTIGDGCPFLQSTFLAPADVWGDAAGNLDILDAGDFRVRRATASTGLITSIVGTGKAGNSDSATAASGTIGTGASGIIVDSTGDLFIADTGNSKIRMVTVAGALITVAGTAAGSTAAPGPAGDGNSAISAYLNLPTGVTVDASNNIYIADMQNSRIREVLVNTGIVNLTSQSVNVASAVAAANTATFLNTGTAPLTFTAITVTAPFSEKTGVSTDCKVGTAVAVGGTCTLTLLYTPAAAGEVTGTATLQSNAANAPSGTTTLQLYGIGVGAGKLTSTTTVTTSFPGVPSETVGQSVTLTATVSGGATATLTPTGTVLFSSGTTVLGTATLIPSSISTVAAIATFTTTALTVGVDAVMATYLGDTNYATSATTATTSPIIGVFTGAMDFAFSANATSLSVANGSSVPIVLNAYSLGGYSGTVGFQCPNLPPGATCTFVPFTSYIGPGRQSTPNVTLTLAFPLPLGSQNRQSTPWRSNGEIALAVLFCGAFFFRRKGRAALLPTLMLAVGIFAMSSLSGCSSAPTEKSLVGTYNIQVVASDGVLSHTATVAVKVQ